MATHESGGIWSSSPKGPGAARAEGLQARVAGIISKRKERVISGLVMFGGWVEKWGDGEGMAGILSCRFPTVLIKKFQTDWFKFPLSGQAETAIRLVTELWFGDVA